MSLLRRSRGVVLAFVGSSSLFACAAEDGTALTSPSAPTPGFPSPTRPQPSGLLGEIEGVFVARDHRLSVRVLPASPIGLAAYRQMPTTNGTPGGDLLSAASSFRAYCTTSGCTDENGSTVPDTTCPGWTRSSGKPAYCFDVWLVNGYAQSFDNAYLVFSHMKPSVGHRSLNSSTPPATSGLSSPFGLWAMGDVPAVDAATGAPGTSTPVVMTLGAETDDFSFRAQIFADACAASEQLCGSSCVSFLTDANNCGACGRVCGSGSSCSNGVCAPVTMATVASATPYFLEQSATEIFFAGYANGGVYKVAKTAASATPTTMATGQSSPAQLAAAGSRLYFGVSGGLRSLPQAAPFSVTTVDTTSMGAYGAIATDDTHVYWTTYTTGATGRLLRKPLAGGATQTLVSTGLTKAFRIAVDASNVFLLEWGTGGRILRVPKAGGALTSLATGSEPIGLALDDDNVYWLDNVAGTVNKVSKLGGANTVLVSGRTQPDAIAVDRSVTPPMIYWSDDTDSTFEPGLIVRVPTTGGAPELLAKNQNNPTSLVVDADNVYWVAAGENAVRRLKKPPIGVSQPQTVCNRKVLLLRDTAANYTANVSKLKAALEAQGMSVLDQGTNSIATGIAVNDPDTGAVADPTAFGAIVLWTGETTTNMAAAAQTAIENAVTNYRVGLVMTGGASEHRRAGRWATLNTHVLLTSTGTATATLRIDDANAAPSAAWSSEIFQAVATSHSPTANVEHITGASLAQGASVLAYATPTSGGSARIFAAVREGDQVGRGRVVELGFTGKRTAGAANLQYVAANPPSPETPPNDFTRTIVNSVRWAAKCL